MIIKLLVNPRCSDVRYQSHIYFVFTMSMCFYFYVWFVFVMIWTLSLTNKEMMMMMKTRTTHFVSIFCSYLLVTVTGVKYQWEFQDPYSDPYFAVDSSS